ncbi:phosphotransferase family protein [Celeribacter sp.]|uniref:phosphotransferase family protein n=1 Tax=Celeribacter sp. TaxID=1890673 RepID=UPI003A91FAEB
MTNSELPPPAIRSAAARFLTDDAVWSAFEGGRTNTGWRGRDGHRDLVFKLYRVDRSNPVFPNDPHAEWRVLSALKGTNLAPQPVELLEVEGQSCLVYDYVSGETFETATPEMARALGTLHAMPPSGLSGSRADTGGLIGAGCALFDDDPAPIRVDYGERRVFLHGDPTPANALKTADGVRFLDWQCPTHGDPVDDLAVLVSPAMHVVYGARVLTSFERRMVLEAYPDKATVARYQLLAPDLSRAIANYCRWKVACGEEDYAPALDAEMAYLAALT